MVWKRWFLLNMAIFGIYVKFLRGRKGASVIEKTRYPWFFECLFRWTVSSQDGESFFPTNMVAYATLSQRFNIFRRIFYVDAGEFPNLSSGYFSFSNSLSTNPHFIWKVWICQEDMFLLGYVEAFSDVIVASLWMFNQHPPKNILPEMSIQKPTFCQGPWAAL